MPKLISRACASWEVQRAVWALDRCEGLRPEGASIQEVTDQLRSFRTSPVDYRTVATHLRTLKDKGLVRSQTVGHQLYYRPLLDEGTAVRSEISAFFDLVIHDDFALLEQVQRELNKRCEVFKYQLYEQQALPLGSLERHRFRFARA